MREPHLPDNQASASPVLPEFIGESVGVTNLKAEVAYLLARQGHGRRLPTLLLQGETGTGKGLLARSIHKGSIRATRPFVDIDCAAIPETLLEAELFGVERGAYTDARQTRPGLFQTATGGTLFLDEIGLLPRSLQAKLLKVVEERGVRRLGSTHSEKVDVWLLAATNVNLAAAVRDGSFREDLYHRLAAVTLMLPPLRSREGDILLLAEHFLERMCAECRLPLKTLAPEAVAAMLAYRWPGNVRELLNRLERVVLMSGEDTVISAERLGLPPVPAAQESQLASREPPRFRSLVDDFERERLLEALRGARGNISMTAARLGLPRNTLRYRMVKLGIEAREELQGVGTLQRQVGHVIRLIEQHAGLLPRLRLVSPVGEFRRDAGIEVRSSLQIAKQRDRVARRLDDVFETLDAHLRLTFLQETKKALHAAIRLAAL